VDSYRGDITIEGSDAMEVRVVVNFDFDVETEAEADRLWEGFKFDGKSDRNVVSVVVRNPTVSGIRFTWEEREQMIPYYRISVPRECNLKLKTLTGDITVGRIKGRMSAEVGKGTVFFRGVDGSIDAAVESGDVVISRCTGGVTARVLRGAIRIGTLGGSSELTSSNGGIEVLRLDGALTAFAEVGDVAVNFPRHTLQPAKLTSSGGNVRVKIDPAANCNVEASAMWGSVESVLRLSGQTDSGSKRRLTGRLNQGGPLLQLRANGGSVTIEPGETLFE
jgi:DUF4097 and DUF4098 domain-containing protein YvlB